MSFYSCEYFNLFILVNTASKTAKETQVESNDARNTNSVELETIVVTAKKVLSRKDNDVTGLGKVVKTADDISEQQVLGIRDLTRYDPGISVVEQGRGASSGYAIRGVDKNRVGMFVDGLPQAQSYLMHTSPIKNMSSTRRAATENANSGAMNEIEYENISAIGISKGASSSEYGSGALGGALGFRTKNSADVIKEDQNWGIDTKTAYSSKNKQLMNSISLAGKAKGFDVLAVYTKRDGEETHPHDAASDIKYDIQKLDTYTDETSTGQWFVVESECPDLTNCQSKPPAYILRENVPVTQMSAEEYTGPARILPNPMDYKSDSLLLKAGYQFTPEHYVNAVLEDTKQQYDIRDMSLPAYYDTSEEKRINTLSRTYVGDNPLSGVVINNGKKVYGMYSLNWARARFFDEHHHKRRVGAAYEYTSADNDGWIDSARLSYDRQTVGLENEMQESRCSQYPNVDKNCTPSLDKLFSQKLTSQQKHEEKHDLLQLNLSKTINYNGQKHRINGLLGSDNFSSKLTRDHYQAQYVDANWGSSTGGPGSKDKPWIHPSQPELITNDLCGCEPRLIDGHNYFVSLRDNMSLNKYLDVGLGVRYDTHKFNSDDKFTGTGTYDNVSWNGGVTVKPNQNLALSYRVSNGFRVPFFYELYGYRGDGQSKHWVSNLDPEEALNQEFGINIEGDLGYIETSYFNNDYKGLIDTAYIRGEDKSQGFHNLYDVTLQGINVSGKVDGNALSEKIPYGVYGTLAYNHVKLKNREYDKQKFTNANDPILDAIQPGRYVVGLGYDSPNENWGVNWLATYSKAKNADEIIGKEQIGGKEHDIKNQQLSNSWYTHDLVGYFKFKDKYTLRAGVYNLLNRKYSTWESVRQSSINAPNQDQPDAQGNTPNLGARYAAPGINITASLEMKF